ncbi:hypothetical protein PTSG_08168 [Salpingoeca rosetta]|uniref:Suppressor of white apricot N-terminal domain-containing protein n=1 Tax=Salpingoeca rosetta (strain ATCC 50818 / BSB-021) TaxID=946362 RepID=F2UI71_SALR5|nr:uncharacterized protein PTSG_08168 [Salpingoeca rosetta]EGD76820.1 hypothetical protein PTSG_08168 [Salpingoeca rosetta]|eukprot:XP_004991192.1 hypothetical protein PTSG_08168 [Salpingoeca rosetta]
MWHAARKHDRHLKELVAATRKRSQQRQAEAIQQQVDPLQLLRLQGVPCHVHFVSESEARANMGRATLVPWQNHMDHLIDRFDVRASMDAMDLMDAEAHDLESNVDAGITVSSQPSSMHASEPDERMQHGSKYFERRFEAYRDLVHTAFKRISETEHLRLIDALDDSSNPFSPQLSARKGPPAPKPAETSSNNTAAIGFDYGGNASAAVVDTAHTAQGSSGAAADSAKNASAGSTHPAGDNAVDAMCDASDDDEDNDGNGIDDTHAHKLLLRDLEQELSRLDSRDRADIDSIARHQYDISYFCTFLERSRELTRQREKALRDQKQYQLRRFKNHSAVHTDTAATTTTTSAGTQGGDDGGGDGGGGGNRGRDPCTRARGERPSRSRSPDWRGRRRRRGGGGDDGDDGDDGDGGRYGGRRRSGSSRRRHDSKERSRDRRGGRRSERGRRPPNKLPAFAIPLDKDNDDDSADKRLPSVRSDDDDNGGYGARERRRDRDRGGRRRGGRAARTRGGRRSKTPEGKAVYITSFTMGDSDGSGDNSDVGGLTAIEQRNDSTYAAAFHPSAAATIVATAGGTTANASNTPHTTTLTTSKAKGQHEPSWRARVTPDRDVTSSSLARRVLRSDDSSPSPSPSRQSSSSSSSSDVSSASASPTRGSTSSSKKGVRRKKRTRNERTRRDSEKRRGSRRGSDDDRVRSGRRSCSRSRSRSRGRERRGGRRRSRSRSAERRRRVGDRDGRSVDRRGRNAGTREQERSSRRNERGERRRSRRSRGTSRSRSTSRYEARDHRHRRRDRDRSRRGGDDHDDRKQRGKSPAPATPPQQKLPEVDMKKLTPMERMQLRLKMQLQKSQQEERAKEKTREVERKRLGL